VPEVSDSSTSATSSSTAATSVKTFTASKSGAFDDSATWEGGIVPSSECFIIIPSNIVVSFADASLELNVRTLTIYGSFEITTEDDAGFTFKFVVNMIIRGGGSLKDSTAKKRIYCLAGSLFTFLDKATFTGSESEVFVYKTLPASSSVGESFKLGSSLSGPFTAGVSLGGTVRKFPSVMCIVADSGSFTKDSSWLGGIAPSVSFCSDVGSCGLFIPPGLSLDTDSLNGQLDIDFNLVTVSLGASFKLGSPKSTRGFRFRKALKLVIYGEIDYKADVSAGIFIPFKSQFNCYPGSSITAESSITLKIVNPLNDETVGPGVPLAVGISGAFFVDVSETGSPSISTVGR
jgi:hypothetical protein